MMLIQRTLCIHLHSKRGPPMGMGQRCSEDEPTSHLPAGPPGQGTLRSVMRANSY